MITEIKNYLKNILIDITGVPEDCIFLSLKEKNYYKVAPWISITTEDKSTIKVEWKKENKREDEKKVYLVERKYTKTIPFAVVIGAIDENQADIWIENFLAKLAKEIIVGNTNIKIEPKSVEYSDQVSLMTDAYVAACTIDFVYGIYREKGFGKIDKIKIRNIEIR